MTITVDPATGREILLMEAFAYNGQYEVKATGFRGTALAGTTKNLDFPVGAEDRHINGLRIILDGHAANDTIDFHVVDVDGALGLPLGYVLKTFGTNWNVDSTKSDQGRDTFNFVARLPAGAYIRVTYTSTGVTDVTVKVNTVLHKKTA